MSIAIGGRYHIHHNMVELGFAIGADISGGQIFNDDNMDAEVRQVEKGQDISIDRDIGAVQCMGSRNFTNTRHQDGFVESRLYCANIVVHIFSVALWPWDIGNSIIIFPCPAFNCIIIIPRGGPVHLVFYQGDFISMCCCPWIELGIETSAGRAGGGCELLKGRLAVDRVAANIHGH